MRPERLLPIATVMAALRLLVPGAAATALALLPVAAPLAATLAYFAAAEACASANSAWQQSLESARQAFSRDDYGKAEELARQAINELPAGQSRSESQAACQSLLGDSLLYQGRFAAAAAAYESALSILEPLLAPSDPRLAGPVADLAYALKHAGQFSRAEPLMKRAIALSASAGGPQAHSTAEYRRRLGSLYVETGRNAEAEPLLRGALADFEKLYGAESGKVAETLYTLGSSLVEQDRMAEAEPTFKRIVAIREKLSGKDSPHAAAALRYLGAIASAAGEEEKAADYYVRSLAATEKKYGRRHLATANAMSFLANSFRRQGNLEKAEALLRESAETARLAVGARHKTYATFLLNLSGVLYLQGKVRESAALAGAGTEIFIDQVGIDSHETAQALSQLAAITAGAGDLAAAEKHFKTSYKTKRRYFGETEKSGMHERLPLLYKMRATPLADLAGGTAAPAEAAIEIAAIENEAGALSAEAALIKRDGIDSEQPVFPLYEKLRLYRLKKQGKADPRYAEILMQGALIFAKYGYKKRDWLEEASETLYAFAPALDPGTGVSDAAARAIREMGGRQKARRYAIDSLILLGLLSDYWDDRAEARKAWELARTLNSSPPSADGERSERFLTLAECFKGSADLARARDCITAALAADSRSASAAKARATLARAEIELVIGDYGRALQSAQAALKTTPLPGELSRRAKLVAASAIFQERQGKTDAKGPDWQEAAVLVGELVAGESKETTAAGSQSIAVPARLLAARLALAGSDRQAARQHTERALSLLPARSSPAELQMKADIYAFQSELERRLANMEAARSLCTRALAIHKLDVSPQGIIATIRDYNRLAELDAARSDREVALREALAGARLAERYVSTVFPQLSVPEQCAFAEFLREESGTLIAVGRWAGAVKDAYPFLMKWKGLLVEALRQQHAEAAGSPALFRLNLRLKTIKQQMARAAFSKGYAADDFVLLAAEREELERQLRAQATGKRLEDPLGNKDMETFAQRLASDEAFVDIYEYTPLGADAPHYGAVVLVSDGSLQFVDLGAAAETDRQIRLWLRSLATPAASEPAPAGAVPDQTQGERAVKLHGAPAGPGRQPQPREPALRAALSASLWQELSRALPGRTTRLVFCPEGMLSRIPLDLLPSEEERQRLFIAEVDSARELYILRTTGGAGAGTAAITLVGGVDFGSSAAPPLPGTLAEVEQIAGQAADKKFAVALLKQREATSERVARQLAGSSIAHIATHGFFLQQEPQPASASADGSLSGALSRALGVFSAQPIARNPLMLSGLLFAPEDATGDKPGTAGTASPSRLTADDILHCDLSSTRLVTLSACESGLGESVSGQGLLGLRSAILAAGARTVVLSLWKVDDEATRVLMEQFYASLWAGGSTPAAALKAAREKVRTMPGKNWGHPYYWAAWILVGQAW